MSTVPITNVSDDDREVPALGGLVILAGQTVAVDEDLVGRAPDPDDPDDPGEGLLAQPYFELGTEADLAANAEPALCGASNPDGPEICELPAGHADPVEDEHSIVVEAHHGGDAWWGELTDDGGAEEQLDEIEDEETQS